jgi:hypothetical protein
MAYEQPNPITVPPSKMFTSLAPLPRPDYFSRTFVSDLPSRPSDHVKPPPLSKKGLYKNPARTNVPGPPLPRRKALTKKLGRTGAKERIATDAAGKVKILHNGQPVKRSRKSKEPKGKKKRKNQ